MNAATVVEMLEREPFRICLNSGEDHAVRNPHMVAVMKTRLFVALPDERSTFVSYMHIAALETLRNGNGHTRRKRRGR